MEIARVGAHVHKSATCRPSDPWDSDANVYFHGASQEVGIRRRLLLIRARSIWGRLVRAWAQVPDSILVAERVECDYGDAMGVCVARIVMQPLEVPSLFPRCGAPEITTRACAHVVRRVAHALNYLHHHGVLHFDVACENIGLWRDGDFESAVLYDFTHSRPFGTTLMEGEHSRMAYASYFEADGALLLPRVDFHQLFYSVARLLLGRLPWEDFLDDERRVVEAKHNFKPGHPFLDRLWSALAGMGHVFPSHVAESDAYAAHIEEVCASTQ